MTRAVATSQRLRATQDRWIPPLRAALAGLELAASVGVRLRVVNVLRDHLLTEALERACGTGDVRQRRDLAAASLLDRGAGLARASGVLVETRWMEGGPPRRILA